MQCNISRLTDDSSQKNRQSIISEVSSEARLFWKLLAVQHFTTRSHEQACFSVGIEIESAVFGCNVAEQRDVTVLMDSAEKHNAHAPYFTGKSRVRSNFFPFRPPKKIVRN